MEKALISLLLLTASAICLASETVEERMARVSAMEPGMRCDYLASQEGLGIINARIHGMPDGQPWTEEAMRGHLRQWLASTPGVADWYGPLMEEWITSVFRHPREDLHSWPAVAAELCRKRFGVSSATDVLRASRIDNRTAAILYAAALRYVPHYGKPPRAPVVHQLSHARLLEKLCADADAWRNQCFQSGMRLRGFTQGNAIYVEDRMVYGFGEEMDALAERSVWVHEFVHYLQEWAKGTPVDCPDVIEREKEAYSVQSRYLLENRAPMMMIRTLTSGIRTFGCGNHAMDRVVLVTYYVHQQTGIVKSVVVRYDLTPEECAIEAAIVRPAPQPYLLVVEECRATEPDMKEVLGKPKR